MKVTIVGAGNVGASCAEYILIKQIAEEVILVDIKDGFAEGKALDLTQTTSTLGFKSKVLGVTNDYEKISQAYGLPYIKISNESQVDKKLSQILSKRGPIVCEVMIDDKINYQPKVSSKRDSEGRIISAELYDMSPFISDEDLQLILDIKNQ